MWEMTTTVIVPQPSGKLMIVAFIAGINGSRVYCKVGHPHLAMDTHTLQWSDFNEKRKWFRCNTL
jgi:hypothetical protein